MLCVKSDMNEQRHMEDHENDDDLTVRAAYRNLLSFLRDLVAIITGVGAVVGGVWYLAGDHLQHIADLPDNNNRITVKLQEIQSYLYAIKFAQISNLRPIVEFHGRPGVVPRRTQPDQRAFVAYHLRRNEACSGTLIRRWWNAQSGIYDPRFQSTFDVQRAPVTSRFQLWRLPLDVPELPPGQWAYHPELVPGPDCASDLPVIMPPAYFEVANE